MSSTVTNYIQPLTQPLDGLFTSFTQLASQHRDMNDRLHSHKDDLLSNATFAFQGLGADAFASLVDSYLETSEKHMQAFDDASSAVRTCHSTITTASNTADAAGLHEGLTNHVLSQVSHNDIIQRGSDPIWSVVNDLIRSLGKATADQIDFFKNVITFNFGNALDDLVQAGKDVSQMVSDATSLLQDIGRVLGQCAETIWSAVQNCLSALWSAMQDVMKFVSPYMSWVNNAIGVIGKLVKSEDLAGKLDKEGMYISFLSVLFNWLDGTDNTPKKLFSDIIGNGLQLIPGVDVVALVLGVTSDALQLLGGAQQNLIAPWIAGNNTTLKQYLSQDGADLSKDAQGIDPGAVFTDLGALDYDVDPAGGVVRTFAAGYQFIQNPEGYINDPNKLEQLTQSIAPDPGTVWGDVKKVGGDLGDMGKSVLTTAADVGATGINDWDAFHGGSSSQQDIANNNRVLEQVRSEINSDPIKWLTSGSQGDGAWLIDI